MAKAERKRNTMKRSFDASNETHTWTFADAKVEPLVLDEKRLPMEIKHALFHHGVNAKIGDAAAIQHDRTTGRAATDADKRAAMESVIENLYNGIFNTKGGGGVKVVSVDALVAAIAATLKRNVVKVREFVESRDDDGRKALADSEQFREAYALAVAAARPVRKLDDELQAAVDAIPE